MTGWLRSRAYDLWIGLKPSRFGLLTVLLVILGFIEPWTGQGRDALLNYADSGFSGSDLLRRFWLYLATFCLAILTWFFCRLSGSLRFAGEKEILHRYRKEFPSAQFDRTDPTQEQAIADDAEARVNKILSTRKWTPRVLSILIPLVLAGAFWLHVGIAAAWRDLLIFLVIAVIVGAAVIGRREFQNWLADWFSRRQPWLSVFLQTGDANHAVMAWSEIGGFAKTVLWIVSAFVIVGVVCALIWPLPFGQVFGPVPVIMLSLTVILGIGSLLAMRTRDSNFPWFTALVTAIAVASMFGGHTMRFADDHVAPDQRPSPEELADQFFTKLPGDAPKPAILVATAGGGSRAAYWTATVLGELNTIPGFNDHLLLISGVSGGSLGALLYRAATLAAPDDPDKALAIAQEAAAGDFLSPLLSAMFTRDLVSDLIPGLHDRAEVLEQAWSDSFNKACRDKPKPETCPDLDKGFLRLWPRDGPSWPALILNGTVVETGGRAVASNIDLACDGGDPTATCGLVDVTDILAYHPSKLDLTASGAVNVSARFPVLGPSAVTIINEKGDKRSVVDGGYFDNSGALTLQQVMYELEPVFNGKDEDKDKKIVPIVIQITSDPDFKWWKDNLRGHLDPGNREPGGHQLVMPLRTYLGLRGSFGRQAMLGLKSLAERDGIYIHFDQCSGAPLAWVISNEAQQSLRSLMDPEAKTNSEAGPEVKSDSENCGNNNAASVARVKACLEDVNGAECLGKKAEGQSPNT